MIKTLQAGGYLVNGAELIPDGPDAAEAVKAKTGTSPDKAEAKKNTIAYGILKEQ